MVSTMPKDRFGLPYAVWNPEGREEEILPVIWGFNNGGHQDMWTGVLLAEDGTSLGSHLCSAEGYMYADLGILAKCREDRHEQDFKKHYPQGYRMDFVPRAETKRHVGLAKAIENNHKKYEGEEKK